MKRLKNTIFLFIAILIIVIAGYVVSNIYLTQGGSAEEEYFTIEKGDSLSQITDNLVEQGFVKNKLLWILNVKYKKSYSDMYAGSHKLAPNFSYNKIIQCLTGPPPKQEEKITIIEGWRINQISDYLESKAIIEKSDDFINQAIDLSLWQDKYDFLKDLSNKNSLEGFLFPDTYQIYKETDIETIISKTLDNFQTKINPFKEVIDKNEMSLLEIVILASIVEKEARGEENMRLVADVYLKRLENNTMRLQSDPTVNYVTGKSTDRPTLEDTYIDSLYNTYRNDGLPPGPICNPSLTAIKAVLDPLENEYYYFINTSEGEMVYARNFEEHQRNREKYLK